MTTRRNCWLTLAALRIARRSASEPCEIVVPRHQRRARATFRGSLPDEEAEAAKIAGLILQAYPAAAGRDAVQVTIAEGFDIGIASGWVTRGFVYTPREWREKIRAAVAPGATQAPGASPVPTAR